MAEKVLSLEFRLGSCMDGTPDHEIMIPITSNTSLDVNEVCSEALKSNTAIGYSGRHDHGSLPTLKSTGGILDVVVAIKNAKTACDAYLTNLIQNDICTAPAEKKARIYTSGDEEEGDGVVMET